jgi:hypothetical protein
LWLLHRPPCVSSPIELHILQPAQDFRFLLIVILLGD